eukprot:PhF_6_TR19595/c0_g1_i2/m.28586
MFGNKITSTSRRFHVFPYILLISFLMFDKVISAQWSYYDDNNRRAVRISAVLPIGMFTFFAFIVIPCTAIMYLWGTYCARRYMAGEIHVRDVQVIACCNLVVCCVFVLIPGAEYFVCDPRRVAACGHLYCLLCVLPSWLRHEVRSAAYVGIISVCVVVVICGTLATYEKTSGGRISFSKFFESLVTLSFHLPFFIRNVSCFAFVRDVLPPPLGSFGFLFTFGLWKLVTVVCMISLHIVVPEHMISMGAVSLAAVAPWSALRRM